MTNKILCPICKNGSVEFLKTVSHGKLFHCNKCMIRFSDPMVHPGVDWYEDSDIYEEVRWNLPNIKSLIKRWEFAEALNLLSSEDKRILDIGCGRGDFLKLADSRGFEAHGIDLNQHLVRVAREAYGLKYVTHSSFESFLNEDSISKFDVVTAFEVLEHLSDPHDFISKCMSILREDGKLILSVPGYNRFPRLVNNDVDLPPHHLILWSEIGLLTLLKAHGLKNFHFASKPLLLDDLMYHIVRMVPFAQKPGFFSKGLRGVLKIMTFPIWKILTLFPKAGGFTLLVKAHK